jgi:hypothetical protein
VPCQWAALPAINPCCLLERAYMCPWVASHALLVKIDVNGNMLNPRFKLLAFHINKVQLEAQQGAPCCRAVVRRPAPLPLPRRRLAGFAVGSCHCALLA